MELFAIILKVLVPVFLAVGVLLNAVSFAQGRADAPLDLALDVMTGTATKLRLAVELVLFACITACAPRPANLLYDLPDDVRIAFYSSSEYGEPTIERRKFPPFDDLVLPKELSFVATYIRRPLHEHWVAFKTTLPTSAILAKITEALGQQGWRTIDMQGYPPFGSATVICHKTLGHVQVSVREYEDVRYVIFDMQPGTCADLMRILSGPTIRER